MKNVFKGLTVVGLAALMVGCGAVNNTNPTTNTAEKTVQKTDTAKKATTNTDSTKKDTTKTDTTKNNTAKTDTSKTNTTNTTNTAKTNTSSTTQQGIGSGVHANPNNPSEQQGIGSGVTGEGQVQGIGSGVHDTEENYINHTYKVVVDKLNVRDSASTKGKVVSSLSAGEEMYIMQVEINKEDGSVWALVNNGFVCIHDAQGNWFMQIK